MVYYFVASKGRCPQSISRVASADKKTAIVDFQMGNVYQQFELPIGQYPYSVTIGDLTCNFNVNIFGKLSAYWYISIEERVVIGH